MSNSTAPQLTQNTGINLDARLNLTPTPEALERKRRLLVPMQWTVLVTCVVTLAATWLGNNALSWSALLGIIVISIGLVFTRAGLFQLARWLFALSPNVIILVEAVPLQPETTGIPSLVVIMMCFAIVPAILFDISEWKAMVTAMVVSQLWIFVFWFANPVFRIGEGLPQLANPVSYWIGIGFSLVLLASSIGYLIWSNYRAEVRALQLLHETEEQREELRQNLEVIAEQQQDIADSIQYARRIQHSLLPDLTLLSDTHLQTQVLYRPLSVVSGDFYWGRNEGNYQWLAAVDCTGHGVPGAFMSVLGHSLLNQIIDTQPTAQPSDVLTALDAGIRRNLQQDGAGRSGTLDGMDLVLVRIDTAQMQLSFAGANRPLWYLRDGQLHKIAGTRRPAGGQTDFDTPFAQEDLALQPGDRLFLFTDGLTDWMGPEGKFKPRRVETLLTETGTLPLATQLEVIQTELARWSGEIRAVDDLLLLATEVQA